MITPWGIVFLKSFRKGMICFGFPCLIIELIGFSVIGTRYVWLNPVLVITGYMGFYIAAIFFISAELTLSIFNQERGSHE